MKVASGCKHARFFLARILLLCPYRALYPYRITPHLQVSVSRVSHCAVDRSIVRSSSATVRRQWVYVSGSAERRPWSSARENQSSRERSRPANNDWSGAVVVTEDTGCRRDDSLENERWTKDGLSRIRATPGNLSEPSIPLRPPRLPAPPKKQQVPPRAANLRNSHLAQSKREGYLALADGINKRMHRPGIEPGAGRIIRGL
jgi:hypothetical protein